MKCSHPECFTALLLLIIRRCDEVRRYDDQSHFTDEEAEAQSRDMVTCSGSHSWTWRRLDENRDSLIPQPTLPRYSAALVPARCPRWPCMGARSGRQGANKRGQGSEIPLLRGFSLALAGSYSLSVRDYDPQLRDAVKHYKIRTLDSGGFYVSPRSTFGTLQELVAHYKSEFCPGAASQPGGPVPRESSGRVRCSRRGLLSSS